jgi:MarR family multiple antibiotic resistance transcriptional regulator
LLHPNQQPLKTNTTKGFLRKVFLHLSEYYYFYYTNHKQALIAPTLEFFSIHLLIGVVFCCRVLTIIVSWLIISILTNLSKNMKEFNFSPIKKTFHSILKLSKADMQKRFAEAKVGITPLQYSVLSMVRCKPITINNIAKHFDFKAPSLVPVADALEADGFIERILDEDDRRKTMLVIKIKGLDLLKKFPRNDKKDALDVAFVKLSKNKQKELLSLLEELLSNFSQ